MSYELCTCRVPHGCTAKQNGCICHGCGKISLEVDVLTICKICGKDIMLHCESEEVDCFRISREGRLN